MPIMKNRLTTSSSAGGAAQPRPTDKEDGGKWFYVGSNRQRQGPVTEEALQELYDSGEVKAATLVWAKGQAGWFPLEKVEALASIIAGKEETESVDHWINVLNVQPSAGNVQTLAEHLAEKPVEWLLEFVEQQGVRYLCELLELLEKKTTKNAVDFELMEQAVNCLRECMNLAQGMDAILGEGGGAARAGHASRQRRIGISQLAFIVDTKRRTAQAKRVQCNALKLLAAAAMYSAEGHKQVLAALDELRMTRRRLQRFGWLVEACNQVLDADAPEDTSRPALLASSVTCGDNHVCELVHLIAPILDRPAFRRTSIDGGAMDMMTMPSFRRRADRRTDAAETMDMMKGRRTDRRTDMREGVGGLGMIGEEGAEGGNLFTIGEAKAAMGMEVKVITSILMLINSIIGFPAELKMRVKLRAEFINLQLLDVIASLSTQKHVDVVRQVEVFYRDMAADDHEVAAMTRPLEPRKTPSGSGSALAGISEADESDESPPLGELQAHFFRAETGSTEQLIGEMNERAKAGDAVTAAIASPLQLLQSTAIGNEKLLPVFLSVVRALSSIPDSEVGLTVWRHIEKAVEIGALISVSHNSTEEARASLSQRMPLGAAAAAAAAAISAASSPVAASNGSSPSAPAAPPIAQGGAPPPPPPIAPGGAPPPPPPIAPGGAPPPPPPIAPGGAPPPPPPIAPGGAPPPPPPIAPGGAPPPPPPIAPGAAPPPPPPLAPGGAPPPPIAPGGAPAPPLAPGAPPPPAPPGAAGAPALPKKPNVKPSAPVRQFHWTKLADMRIKGTLWEAVTDEDINVDVGELESLFSTSAPRSSPAEKENAGQEKTPKKIDPKKPDVVTLLDQKTANNIAIALSRFKLSPTQIAKALEIADEGAMTAEQLASLLGILPSSEEVELVQSYTGPPSQLDKAEQFVHAIAAVPRYTMRCKCMLFRADFDEKFSELSESVATVLAAANEVRESPSLKVVMRHTLAIGNYLNGGTAKGGAYGFRLDSLNKLSNTKTSDNKSTLLHYLARVLASASTSTETPVTMLLSKEMPHIEAAARLIWKDEVAEIASFSASLAQIEAQVKIDSVAAFTKALGTFHQGASQSLAILMKTKAEAEEASTKTIAWIGESPTAQPEEVFGPLSDFVLTLEKAHVYNCDLDEKEEKAKRRAAEAAQRQLAAAAPPTSTSSTPTTTGKSTPSASGNDADRTPEKQQQDGGSFFNKMATAIRRGTSDKRDTDKQDKEPQAAPPSSTSKPWWHAEPSGDMKATDKSISFLARHGRARKQPNDQSARAGGRRTDLAARRTEDAGRRTNLVEELEEGMANGTLSQDRRFYSFRKKQNASGEVKERTETLLKHSKQPGLQEIRESSSSQNTSLKDLSRDLNSPRGSSQPSSAKELDSPTSTKMHSAKI